MKQQSYDVVIIGAGIAGCATAYYLSKAGVRVALIDKGRIAGEASQAGAGMLAPLADHPSEMLEPFQVLCLAGLQHYASLDQQLKEETGIEIELVHAPTLRPAFDQERAEDLQAVMKQQQLTGLQWLNRQEALEREPLLPEQVLGALLSPREENVQVTRLTQAFARGAALHQAHIFEGRVAGALIQQGSQVVGVETDQGPLFGEKMLLAAGAWANQWHMAIAQPPLFPVKGQIMAIRAEPGQHLRHTIYHPHVGGLVPKADGSIYVAATSEQVGFDKSVTIEGLQVLFSILARLAPTLKSARFERAWAGLRPGSVDRRPLIGPSRSLPGLWLAGGLFRDGILLGPFTGYLLAEMIQGHVVPCQMDLQPFDPDRFGGWDGSQKP